MKEHDKNPDPVRIIMEEAWLDQYDYPIQWSIDLSRTSSDLAETHRKRLEIFLNEMKERFHDPNTKEP